MKNKRSWFAFPYVIWMALFVVIPILIMTVYAVTTQDPVTQQFIPTGENFTGMGVYLSVFLRSFWLAVVATLVCLLIGYPVAYWMAHEGPGFQRVAMALIMLPMWMNFLLRTYSWMSILENNGLIWSVVRRYYGRGVEPDDLYQLGCLGFLKAVQGFDPEFGTQFSTYAVPKIAGEIRRYLRDNGLIKVGRNLREQSISVYTARERLRVQLGREPVLSELSEATGLTPEEIAALVYGSRPGAGGEKVQVHMSRLRRKLDKAGEGHRYIETVWGCGYRWSR